MRTCHMTMTMNMWDDEDDTDEVDLSYIHLHS